MKRTILFISLMFLIIISVTAQDLMFSYVEGDVSLNEGGTWYEVFIGDMIAGDGTIKLGPNSFVELDTSGDTLILNKPGTYKLGDLLSKRSAVSAWGNNPVFKKFLSGDNSRSSVPTAVMGVRGSATETDDVEWLSEDSMIIDDAVAMIEVGEFMEAIDFLTEEIDFAFDEELSDYNYYIGYSYYMLGSSGRSLFYLDKVESDFDTDYYPDFVVLKGSLLLESLAYKDALTIFIEYLRNDDFSGTAQAVNYLAATALKGLGKDMEAEEKLTITVKMNPSSDIGRSANALLKELK